MTNKKTTLLDIAESLGISIGTVHRALHDHPEVNAATRAKVLQAAKALGYHPNLAARYLSQKRRIRISVNTLKGTTSFWDEVRNGILDESSSAGLRNVELEFRTYPQLGDDATAFQQALAANVDGIIAFPSRPSLVTPWINRAREAKIPVVCVVTDAPASNRIAVVSIDTMASGSLAGDLMGRLLRGKGTVSATVSSLAITEHAEKFQGFCKAIEDFYPEVAVEPAIEDNDIESEAYEKCRALFRRKPDLAGIYVTTEASIPVLSAARNAGMIGKLSIITTDLFSELIPELRSGVVTATIQQRPMTQGRTAFRLLHQHLVEGECPPQVTLAPHLVTRGNLDFFLQRDSFEPSSGETPFKVEATNVG